MSQIAGVVSLLSRATAPQQRGRRAGSELAMRFPNSFEGGDSAWLKPSVPQPPRDNHTDVQVSGPVTDTPILS